jgi:hypothetical protein
MTGTKSKLADLEFEDLKKVMDDRLHGYPTIGPPFDPRTGPEPYEWLRDEFLMGDNSLQSRMGKVVQIFIGELPDLNRWPADIDGNLFAFIELIGEDVVPAISEAIRRCIDSIEEGRPVPEHHAPLLKCLMALGHKRSPEFWMEQYKHLGDRYGAVIFAGLIEHGFETAIQYLPVLCRDEKAAVWIASFIPNLENRFGKEKVQKAFSGPIWNDFSENAKRRFRIMGIIGRRNPFEIITDRLDRKQTRELVAA